MFESERIHFRNYEARDFKFLQAMLGDPQVTRYIGNGKVRNNAQARRFFDWIQSTYGIYPMYGLKLLELRDSAVPIGHAGLVPQIIAGQKEVEIGYWISSEHWERGTRQRRQDCCGTSASIIWGWRG